MPTNYRFYVFLGNKRTNWRTVINGLPQGSVFAPTLLNLYIHDLPETKGLKFLYTDNIPTTYQSINLKEDEKSLAEYLNTMNEYFSKCRLKTNLAKIERKTN